MSLYDAEDDTRPRPASVPQPNVTVYHTSTLTFERPLTRDQLIWWINTLPTVKGLEITVTERGAITASWRQDN